MATTPAQRHRARVLAARGAAATEHGAVITDSGYDLLRLQLAEDRRRLKDIQSIERKIEAKHLLLPKYQDWIVSTLNEGKGAQDEVLMTTLVWHIDVGNFGIALQIAEYAIRHNLILPDTYSRNVATMLMDETAGTALSGKFEDPIEALYCLATVGALTVEQDAQDQARAKLHKATAYEFLKLVNAANEEGIDPDMLEPAKMAMDHLQRAMQLFEGVGVKRDIERLERRLKKAEKTQ